jgi:hypothetical protein
MFLFVMGEIDMGISGNYLGEDYWGWERFLFREFLFGYFWDFTPEYLENGIKGRERGNGSF